MEGGSRAYAGGRWLQELFYSIISEEKYTTSLGECHPCVVPRDVIMSWCANEN